MENIPNNKNIFCIKLYFFICSTYINLPALCAVLSRITPYTEHIYADTVFFVYRKYTTLSVHSTEHAQNTVYTVHSKCMNIKENRRIEKQPSTHSTQFTIHTVKKQRKRELVNQ